MMIVWGNSFREFFGYNLLHWLQCKIILCKCRDGFSACSLFFLNSHWMEELLLSFVEWKTLNWSMQSMICEKWPPYRFYSGVQSWKIGRFLKEFFIKLFDSIAYLRFYGVAFHLKTFKSTLLNFDSKQTKL